ncbi:AVN_HP_G0115570.mRNA.1.CDS.1 [Saccharomyces cerevisiae]|nr:AVN_HP_G0051500.mRNA.1.CDS.1 [Saccharomyces cerevisiae]CAI5157070.1 AVN_HP_G0115570.mRNA.1.CDS.1 [Saccharomyces cerevisiae]CAI6925871.1 AVN_HP_G0051500.mRNA.1.CDS.1 [Saccharomyces cerevisiae]CAI6993153.1 AVN_HP_G0115570.mRNA.1.CDS.1 [Saccharomyces cerevisiae]
MNFVTCHVQMRLLLQRRLVRLRESELFRPQTSLSTFKRHASQKTRPIQKCSRKYARILLLSVLVPYTGYAFYVSLATVKQIDLRNKMCQRLEENNNEVTYKGSLLKYSPLEVLGRFENPFEEYRIQTVFEFFANRVFELFERNRGGIPPDVHQMNKLMPVHKPTWGPNLVDVDPAEETALPLECKVLDELHIPTAVEENEGSKCPVYNTWLGQSCNYTVYNGLRILTDPLFSDFLIHKTLGPKRITQMPSQITEVPKPDIILVSHNHPDHLDLESLEYWSGKDSPLWIVPKGMKSYMTSNGCDNVLELSWWETLQVKKNNEIYHISATPAMHWSGRSLLDTNKSLWCSFLLTHHGNPILFHAGDTGYVKDLFVRIKERFGKGCKLALLPCGQYCPEWHQKPRHINPPEVLKIMKDLEARNVLGVHWGTFVLSGEYFLEPKEKLEMLAEWGGFKDRCYCPELGKTECFD